MVLPWRSRGGGDAKRRHHLASGDISVVQTKIPHRPRMLLAPREAAEICQRLENAVAREDNDECFEIVSKIKNLVREEGGGDTSRKCLVQNGVVSALASCFQRFAVARGEHAPLLEEVLLVLASWIPLSRSEGFSKMGSTASLNCLAWFLNASDAKTRQNAALCVREVMALDKRYVHAFTETEGACEGLVEIIKDAVSSSSTKSSLNPIYRAISCDVKNVSRFVKFGLVELLTDMIVNNNAEKSVCERCLIVLNVICDNQEGREVVRRNALIVPLLVKKILRVSALATQCSVSILWKLWKKNGEDDKDRLLIEALQVGAFEKLLVVLQVGCEEKTKERVSDLLRSLNRCRNDIEKANCIDSSMQLKYVKNSF